MQSMSVAGVVVGVFALGCDRPPKPPEVPAQPARLVASTDTVGSSTAGSATAGSSTTEVPTNGAARPAGKASGDTGANRQSSTVNRSSPEPGSTRLGVYTDAQAAEGYDVYLGTCNSCHAGLGNHSGQVFREKWGDRSLADLFYYIAEFMPKSAPGSLSAEDNARVMAYLLKVNGMPAGTVELPTDPAALEKLWLDTTTVKSKKD